VDNAGIFKMRRPFGASPTDQLKDQSRFTSGLRIYAIAKPDKPREIEASDVAKH
jgi:hypothetical protein